LDGHHEAFLRARAFELLVQVVEAFDDVGDIVFLYGITLVVEAKAVCFHVVEPYVVRATVVGACENEDSRGHACVRLEYARGHGDNCLQTIAFDNFLADGLVRFLRSEQHAVRHNGSAASSDLQALQEQR